MSNVSEWSTTAASNNSAAPDGWPEGQSPSSVNDCAREMMAASAKWYKDNNGSLASAGSSNTYTLTTNSAHAALADQSILTFRVNVGNTGSATLNVDSLGAKTMQVYGSNLVSGQLVADSIISVAYNATNDTYDIVSPVDISPSINHLSLSKRVIDGLQMSNDTDTDHDINVTSGNAYDSAGTTQLTLSAQMTKQIDATWASGDDAGGLASGATLSTSTWYHVFIVLVSGAEDVMFDSSLTCANGVANNAVTAYRRIGSVKTDGSSNIIQFKNIGDYFYWDVPVRDVNTTNPGTSVVSSTLSVPSGYSVRADTRFIVTSSSSDAKPYILVTNSTQTDSTPSATINTIAQLDSIGSDFTTTHPVNHLTNTSSQIRYRCSASGTSVVVQIFTHGWKDLRLI